MAGKEALEEIKDAHITKWQDSGVYVMIFKDTYPYRILENEMDRLEKADKELTKYKRAFEILGHHMFVPFGLFNERTGETNYYFGTNYSNHKLTKEEYELLEELMSDEY